MSKLFQIRGKVALVTEGASGIGLEYAKSLLSKGCKTAVIRGTQLAIFKYLPKYKSSDEGIIVNTASLAGLVHYPMPIYVATKHGVVAFGRSMGLKYDTSNIKIITICQEPTAVPIIERVKDELYDYKDINYYPVQPVENLGTALITVIEKGRSGSIWVCHNEPVYEVNAELPDIKNDFIFKRK